jgi:hypothetical protein
MLSEAAQLTILDLSEKKRQVRGDREGRCVLLDLPMRTLTSIKKMANERSIIVKKSDVDMWIEDRGYG